MEPKVATKGQAFLQAVPSPIQRACVPSGPTPMRSGRYRMAFSCCKYIVPMEYHSTIWVFITGL